MITLTKSLTSNHIRRWAGARSYARGERYLHENRVSALSTREGRITATVEGTYPYRVALWEDGDTIDYRCDCPVGLDGDFCKHCVAVALAWQEQQAIDASSGNRNPPKDRQTSLTMKDVHAWLLSQTKETLADMLVEAGAEDEHLNHRLLLKAAATQNADLATYRQVLDRAIGADEFIDYRGMYEYWRKVDETVDGIAELLNQGHADAVIELSEYALAKVERAMECVDDSDGYMSMVLNRLQDLHFAACRKAKPDPKALAKRLFQWELNGEWDTFYGAAETYAKVLGKRGRAYYRELAETEWAKVKPLKPGEDEPGKYGKRFRITQIMKSLAEQSGDIEALVAVKCRDLSLSYYFLQIAEIYKSARQTDKALEWAEKGIDAFGANADSRLEEFLADLYHRRKRHDEAMALIWPQFEAHPKLDSYRNLKKHADRSKSWTAWRARALEHVRALIDKESKTKHDPWSFNAWPDRSLLVEIFLWEQDPEAAWSEAQAGGCRRELWLKLASLREQDHPRDALAVYRRFIEPTVKQTNNDAYAEAVKLLRRMEKLMKRLGEHRQFNDYLASLRAEHKRKRNFMKLLDKFG
jgi:uncharacterized Zn finger protein